MQLNRLVHVSTLSRRIDVYVLWMSLYTNRMRTRLTYHDDVLCLEKFLCLNSYLFKLLLNTGTCTCMCPHCTIYKLKVTPLQS